MAGDNDSPRVLRLTFEFHVPTGLRVNIHGSRVKKAAGAFTTAVQAMAAQVFPWADRMTVRREWSYVWQDHQPDAIQLPATEKNTPQ
ncbi:hypothetical protein [Streptomyces hirsutus]|uniref:hypothetical protein n=1 Tax=Streptomyces hirsutus TaxID=35620 RepID=UPI00332B1F4A